MNGEPLKKEELKFLALTSENLNVYLNRKEYQDAVNILDIDFIRKVEVAIAEDIIDSYYTVRDLWKKKRVYYLLQKSQGTRKKIEHNILQPKAHQHSLLEQRLFALQKRKITRLVENLGNSFAKGRSEGKDIYTLFNVFNNHREKVRNQSIMRQQDPKKPQTGRVDMKDINQIMLSTELNANITSLMHGRIQRKALLRMRHPHSKLMPADEKTNEYTLRKNVEEQAKYRVQSSEKEGQDKTVFVRNYSTGPRKPKQVSPQYEHNAARVIQACLKGFRQRLNSMARLSSGNQSQPNIDRPSTAGPKTVREPGSSKISRAQLLEHISKEGRDRKDLELEEESSKAINFAHSFRVNDQCAKNVNLVATRVRSAQTSRGCWEQGKDALDEKQALLLRWAQDDDLAQLQKARFTILRKDLNFDGGHRGVPLYHSVKNRNLEMTRTFLKHGANPNKVCKNGETVMHEAFRTGNKDIILLLIAHGGQVDTKNHSGKYPHDYSPFAISRDTAWLAQALRLQQEAI